MIVINTENKVSNSYIISILLIIVVINYFIIYIFIYAVTLLKH